MGLAMLHRPSHFNIKAVKEFANKLFYWLEYDAKQFDGALCKGIDTEIFYPDVLVFPPSEERYFRKFCGGCPAKDACLEWGLSHEKYGVWGGTSPATRRHMRKELGIGVAEPRLWENDTVGYGQYER